jgi:hypothetical protein
MFLDYAGRFLMRLKLSSVLSVLSFVPVCMATGSTALAQTVANSAPPAATNWLMVAPFMELKLDLGAQFSAAAGDIIAPRQEIVRYAATPKAGVVLKAASAPRIRTFPQSIPENSILFEVGLSDGIGPSDSVGYCAQRVPEQGVRETQCFVDVNSDGKFDATYTGYETWQGKNLYWGRLANLASIPPVPYEPAGPGVFAPEPMSFSLKRVRNGIAAFELSLGPPNNAVPTRNCKLDRVTPCRLGRHVFTLEAAGAGVKVISVAEVNDGMDITTTRYN